MPEPNQGLFADSDKSYTIANSGTENPIGRLIILTDSLPGRKIPAAKPEAKLGGPQRLSIIATEPSVSTGRA